MKEKDFISQNRPTWQEFDRELQRLEKGRAPSDARQTVATFRRICQQLALARHRLYSDALVEELNFRVIRAMPWFGKAQPRLRDMLWGLVVRTFPRSFSQHYGYFVLSALLFMVPALLIVWAGSRDELWIESVLGRGMMGDLESMYAKDSGAARDSFESDFAMFAFYIFNNVQIGFQMFAGGLLFGLGTVFFLVFNGVYIGAATMHVHQAADPEKFWTFVIGHGSLELIGLVIAGAAGLKLGHSLLRPGAYRRSVALKVAGRGVIPIICMGSLMIFLAAFVEGFWSANAMASGVKYFVGGMGWLLVIAYLVWCRMEGRKMGGDYAS